MTRLVTLSFLVLGGWSVLPMRATIEPMAFRLTALEDSSGYFVYRYTATNPAASTQGVAAIWLDLSASPGTPNNSLPATGRFLDGPALDSPVPVAPHATVGPISPPDWQSVLDRRSAGLEWFGTNGRIFDYDSIAPGDSLPGLGIRSTFFPAVREVKAQPTWQSCCQEPWGTPDDNPQGILPDPKDTAVASYALAPGYAADEITIGLLLSQLSTICADPLWLDDAALCAELAGLLDRARTRASDGDPAGASSELSRVLERVEEERTRMQPEAYGLLHYNARAIMAKGVRSTVRPLFVPVMPRCSPKPRMRREAFFD